MKMAVEGDLHGFLDLCDFSAMFSISNVDNRIEILNCLKSALHLAENQKESCCVLLYSFYSTK
jgi:hypothetical protein